MKKSLLFLFFAVLSTVASAQLVISEISYNPPETGADSLEYIELYNQADVEVQLAGYVISDNNSHTIVEGMIPANSYRILAVNPSAIQTILNESAIKIEDIALSNGGESIKLQAPNGQLIDEVTFSDDAPWPTFDQGTDGAGATIELCDLTADNNDGSNWGVSTNDLGIMVGDKPFLGTPNAANSSSCEFVPDHMVEVSSNMFSPMVLTIKVGESVRWTNKGGNHNVNGSTEAYPNNPEGFSSGAPSTDAWTFDYTFQTAGTYDYKCDPHATFGMTGMVIVEGETEPTVPTYDIGLVNTINGEGIGDSLGTTCILEGVTHGANLNSNGVQCALIDESGDAIGIYSSTNLGYTYNEGDKIKITGTIDQYNGLIQIGDVSAIELISSGNDLTGPVTVETLGEDTESKLVTVEIKSIVDASDWNTEGSSFNATFMTKSGNEIAVRVDSDTEVAGWDNPFVNMNGYTITGIGGQYDTESPYDSGYQLFPRYQSDFALTSSITNELEVSVTLYPNPVVEVLNMLTNDNIDRYTIYSNTGTIVQKGEFKNRIEVSQLATGNYILLLEKEGKTKALTFVK